MHLTMLETHEPSLAAYEVFKARACQVESRNTNSNKRACSAVYSICSCHVLFVQTSTCVCWRPPCKSTTRLVLGSGLRERQWDSRAW
jgi:hypothetical protein